MRSLQARGKPHEASTEVRALLDLVRENEARVRYLSAFCAQILEHVSHHLTILDPEVEEEEFIQAVAAALAKLRCSVRAI